MGINTIEIGGIDRRRIQQAKVKLMEIEYGGEENTAYEREVKLMNNKKKQTQKRFRKENGNRTSNCKRIHERK